MFSFKIVKYNDRKCCFPMRTVWTSIFPDGFLPSAAPVSENELSVPKPRDVKPSDKFPGQWKRMAIQSLIPKTGYQETLDVLVEYPSSINAMSTTLNAKLCERLLR